MVVSQAAYWLGYAGMAQMTGSILVSVLVREIAPILVGIILMGRSGMLSLTEIGMMVLGGEVRGCRPVASILSWRWSCRAPLPLRWAVSHWA